MGLVVADALLYSLPSGRPGLADRLSTYYRRPQDADGWWRFVFADEAFLRQKIELGGRGATVHHASFECSFTTPRTEIKSLSLFDEASRPTGSRIHPSTTFLSEQEVVAGVTQKRLEETLDELAASGSYDYVDVQTTCLPDMIGDNPTAAVRRAAVDHGVPVFWSPKTAREESLYDRMIRDRLKALGGGGERDPQKTILCAAQGQEAEELSGLLARLGLDTERVLLPLLPYDDEPGQLTAGSLVWANPVGWEWLDDALFTDRFQVVKGHPPFGLRGTQRWVRRVSDCLGVDPLAADTLLEDLAHRYAGALDELRARCSKHRVALIGTQQEIEALVAGGSALGFSVGELLKEMGFELELLVYDPEGRLAKVGERGRESGATFHAFSTPEALDAALGDELSLALTSFTRDPRLASHAIAGFGLSVFEMGMEGFLRAGRVLARRAEARPLPGYRGHLASWLGAH